MSHVPMGIAQVLGRRFDGVAHIVLRHERRRQFRWVALIELTLGVFVVLCLLPLIILIAVFGEGDTVELPSIRARFFRYWHELTLTVRGPQGQVLAELRHAPHSSGEGDGIVAAVLDAAQREGAVVVEAIGNDQSTASETVEVWYGGRPLLSPPGLRPEQQAAAVVRQAGMTVEPLDAGIVLREPNPQSARWLTMLLFAFFVVPLCPVLVLFERGRFVLRETWDGVRGMPTSQRQITVRAESVTTEVVRGKRVWDRQVVDGSDLIGITFSPTLGYDREVRRYDATLRFIGRRSSVRIRLHRAGDVGTAVRDLLVAATLRARRARPDLGLLGPGPRPTRCPYCGGLYDMQPGSRCPYCGAPAEHVSIA